MLPQMLEMSRDKPSGLDQPFDLRELLGTPRTLYQSGTPQTYPSVCDGMDLADENPPAAFLRDLDRRAVRVQEQLVRKQLLENDAMHDGFSCMEGFDPGILGGEGLDDPRLGDPLPPVVDGWAPMGNPADEGGGVAEADDGWGGAAASARRVRPRVDPWIGHGQDGQGVLPSGLFWPAPRFPRFSLIALPTETRLAAYEIVRWAVARWGRGPTAAVWSREQMWAQLSVTRQQALGLLQSAFVTDVFVPYRD
jgi:hypothetical protein